MAHMSPINQPWVAMSTCRLATAGERKNEERKKEKGGWGEVHRNKINIKCQLKMYFWAPITVKLSSSC